MFSLWIIVLFLNMVLLADRMVDAGNTNTNAVWVLLIISAIWVDSSPVGSTEFWMTRPISGPQLFAAKLTSMIIIYTLPQALVLVLGKVFGIVPNAWLLNTQNTAAIIPYLFMSFTVMLSFMLAMSLAASSTQLNREMSVSLIIMGTYIILLMQILPSKALAVFLKNPGMAGWIVMILAASGMLFITYNQYKHRHRIVNVGLAVALVTILCALYAVWPAPPH